MLVKAKVVDAAITTPTTNVICKSYEIYANLTLILPRVIITGSKGRRHSGLAKLLLGGVASGVVTYANCPVMMVK